MIVHYTLFKRNNGVVGDGDLLGADLGTAFRDIAESDAVFSLQILCPPVIVKRVHFQRCRVGKKSGTDELVLEIVLAENMADVLT